MSFANIPAALRERSQWVLWKNVTRDGEPTKVPVRPDGGAAKSTDPSTWSSFEQARAAFDPARHAGLGFVFSEADPFVGIDLDGCRDPETGRVAEWAREIITKFGTYAEVSPSRTGVKLFARGKSPFDRGRKFALPEAERLTEKSPAIEVYSHGRYFAVTGQRVVGPTEPTEAPEALAWLKEKLSPAVPPPAIPAPDFHSPAAVLDRARKYLAKVPPAVSGQGGHNATYRAACVLVLGFELSDTDATALLLEWNTNCQPPWSQKDIERKVREAKKASGERGYLRNVPLANWDTVRVPAYKAPEPKSAPRTTTLAAAADRFIEGLKSGPPPLVGTSVPELDYALGGGLAFGEMVIFGGRPSHAKSAVALQAAHHWTRKSTPHSGPCVIISEEMSALALGKRTMQHISDVGQTRWPTAVEQLRSELQNYTAARHDTFVVESCGTAAAAVEAIERHVAEHGCKFAIVDYAQLLKSPGNNRYEQVTNTSIALRQLVSRTQIVLLVLAQLGRGIEQRSGQFEPMMSDLKETGQFEQDADVIAFLCWPHRLDSKEPMERYQFYVMKCRERGIRRSIVEALFVPDRQMVRDRSSADAERSDSDGSL
ncbi:DnaB-like helicase C-terminal domain-containing protein [Frigoriglobus tundricola]|uniref:SF4 helicase domain-containing protein n=1 Tax=Frigoriglobus tundricola TaxID=2774151 RepID=A0A6M5Z4T8_9BACT|nr:DnaB-like helicase C-terminal domain-containing protein [Frigoriglobus tundricola]QJX01249.1 hypothetical protein FTUN_8888 [Frigoriglobus tundricola]